MNQITYEDKKIEAAYTATHEKRFVGHTYLYWGLVGVLVQGASTDIKAHQRIFSARFDV